MPISFRLFKITDTFGLEHKFKHYPNQDGKIVEEKDEIPSTLSARRALYSVIDSLTVYMEDNTICKFEVEEDEE